MRTTCITNAVCILILTAINFDKSLECLLNTAPLLPFFDLFHYLKPLILISKSHLNCILFLDVKPVFFRFGLKGKPVEFGLSEIVVI